jgi:hypothetical protein
LHAQVGKCQEKDVVQVWLQPLVLEVLGAMVTFCLSTFWLTYFSYWQPVNVVFPCGVFIDGDAVWISYGRQDHESWLAKLDLKRQSLLA